MRTIYRELLTLAGKIALVWLVAFALVAAVLLLESLAQEAHAQNVTCPTADFSTDDNRCASTSFVQGAIFAPVVPIAPTGSTFTPNLLLVNFSMTLIHGTCPCVIASPINSKNGSGGFMEMIQSASGSETVTWGSSWKFSGGMAPTLSTGAGAKDILPYFCDAATFCMVGAIQQAFQ